MKFILISVLLLVMVARSVEAETRLLAVDVRIVETEYRQRFQQGGQIGQLERALETGIAQHLAENIPYIDFQAHTTETLRLVVQLGMPAQGVNTDGLYKVDMHTWAEKEGRQSPKLQWAFRGMADALRPIVSVDAFREEILSRFISSMSSNRSDLVRDVLGVVALSEQAYPIPSDKSWVLPFSRCEIEAGERSHFRILAEIQVRSDTERPTYLVESVGDLSDQHNDIPAHFHHKIKTRIIEGGGDRMQQADQVRAMKVFLVRYVPHSCESGDRVRPSSLILTVEGL